MEDREDIARRMAIECGEIGHALALARSRSRVDRAFGSLYRWGGVTLAWGIIVAVALLLWLFAPE